MWKVAVINLAVREQWISMIIPSCWWEKLCKSSKWRKEQLPPLCLSRALLLAYILSLK